MMATRHHRRRDTDGHVDPFHDRKRDFEAFFRGFGLTAAYAMLSRFDQEQIWRMKFPDAVLEFDESFPNGPGDQPLRRECEQRFRDAAVTFCDRPFPARKFAGMFVGMYLHLNGKIDLSEGSPLVRAFIAVARKRLQVVHDDFWPKTITHIASDIDRPLMAHTRLDTRVLTSQYSWKFFPEKNRQALRLTLASQPPETVQVAFDGHSRPAYRAVTYWGGNGAQPISWRADELDLPSPESGELPVFAQAHALKQARARLNVSSMDGIAEAWLLDSLRHPEIVERNGDDLLVAYRVNGKRIGHLVATVADRRVVVRTFLFLTMQGTPESRQLRARLGLRRGDIDWLRLSELRAFTDTDLRDDDELRTLFERCGCGHLFELNPDDFNFSSTSYAAEVRKYLRMAA
jgi:hypothetical protein